MEVYALFDDASAEKVLYQFYESNKDRALVDILYTGNVPEDIKISVDKGIKEAYIYLKNKAYFSSNKLQVGIWYKGFSKVISGNSADLAFATAFLTALIDKGELNSSAESTVFAATGTFRTDGSIAKIGGIKEKLIAAATKISRNSGITVFYPKENQSEIAKLRNEEPAFDRILSKQDIQLIPVGSLKDLIGEFCLKKNPAKASPKIIPSKVILIILGLVMLGLVGYNFQAKDNPAKKFNYLALFTKLENTVKPKIIPVDNQISTKASQPVGKPLSDNTDVVAKPNNFATNNPGDTNSPEDVLKPENATIEKPTKETVDKKVSPKSDVINVGDYGAKADGITDNTKALQKAIDEASVANKKVYIPAAAKPYLVKEQIVIKNNTQISGDGATLYMKAQPDEIKSIFISDRRGYIANVSIKGLTFKSENVIDGNTVEKIPYSKNILVSNVQGIFLSGVKNLVVQNIKMEQLHVGLKLGRSTTGKLNESIQVTNVRIYNTKTPVLMLSTKDYTMTNSILDASNGADRHLHAAHLVGFNSEITFEDVTFRNSPGAGVNIYNGYDGDPSENVTIKNCTIENSYRGMYVCSWAKNVKVINTKIKNTVRALEVYGSHNLTLSTVTISNPNRNLEIISGDQNNPVIIRNPGDKGAFAFNYSTNTIIKNVSVDCENMEGNLFEFGENINGVAVTGLNVVNLNDNGFFYSKSKNIKDLVVEDSSFTWSEITDPTVTKITLRGAGSEANFNNNEFINKGMTCNFLLNNYAGTNVIFENNTYGGFKNLFTTIDCSVKNNNINLDAE